MSTNDVAELLNGKSGFKGFTGHADLREVLKQRDEGIDQADLAIQVKQNMPYSQRSELPL